MAKVGMEYTVSGILTEGSDGTPSYASGRYWGAASSFNLTPSASEVTDYGDDRAVETDASVNTIGVSVELNENTLELESILLGHTYNSSTKEMTTSRDDIAPWIGLGCIGKSMRNNELVYRGIFLYKVQMRDPSDENTTKQDTTTFNHSTYEGTAYALGDATGKLNIKKEFDTLEAAKTWLNGLVSITD